MRYVYVTGYLSLAAIIQLLMGNFPLSFVAFPLNIVFAVIWLFLLWKLYKEVENRLLHASFTPLKQVFYLFSCS